MAKKRIKRFVMGIGEFKGGFQDAIFSDALQPSKFKKSKKKKRTQSLFFPNL